VLVVDIRVGCRVMSNGVELSSSMTMMDALTKMAATSLLCDDINHEYVLQKFEHEDAKQLYNRQSRAGAAPPSSGAGVGASAGADKEYPYLATEILGNTIFADIQWLEAFITHHWYVDPVIAQ
jgi:hypothetical protein